MKSNNRNFQIVKSEKRQEKGFHTVRICSPRCSLISFQRELCIRRGGRTGPPAAPRIVHFGISFLLPFKCNTRMHAHQHVTLQMVHFCSIFLYWKDNFLTKLCDLQQNDLVPCSSPDFWSVFIKVYLVF